MVKSLYVSAFMPRENARHAGGRVSYENLIRLRRDSSQVDVIVCTTESEIEAPSTVGMVVIRHRLLSFAKYLFRNMSGLRLQSLLAAPIIHTRLNLEAEREITDRLRSSNYDEIFVDFTQSILLVLRATQLAGRTPRIVACVHDVFAQRTLRSERLIDIFLAGVILRQEQLLLNSVQCVVTLSAKDRNLLTSLYTCSSVEIKPFSPPSWCSRVVRTSQSIDSRSLIFFGNFDRIENSSAVRWFLQNVMGQVCSAIPEATLTLVGTGSDRFAAELADYRVSGTGFLEDPSMHFSRCALAIAPLFQGAGVKFKVLEALACGVPVIGTPVACEGIDAHLGLVCASAENFATAVIRRLTSVDTGVGLEN